MPQVMQLTELQVASSNGGGAVADRVGIEEQTNSIEVSAVDDI